MEWTIWEEDGFKVGKAIDDSGLMKKTFNIPVYERIHHVVSYYTACDAQTLVRPLKEPDLGPFSNLVPSFDVQSQYHQRQGSPTNTLYACTFSKCFKKFGSKSAWKLHENSRHF
jgi:hypothetical protein